MVASSASGHVSNVANFEKLLMAIESLGESYKPSRSNLQIEAIALLKTEIKAILSKEHAAESDYKNAIVIRKTKYADLNKLITRISNALKASETTSDIDEALQSIIRKLQGKRATARKTEEEKSALAAEGKSTKEISSSQMDYENRVENLDKLVKLLESVKGYAPNEEELQVTTLANLVVDLKEKNSAVNKSNALLSNARITRNELLYKDNVGVCDIAADVKSYIKSAFGASSPQYKNISKLTFKKI